MPVAPTRPPGSAGVVIAIDPHKASWTAVVVNGGLTPVASRGGLTPVTGRGGQVPVAGIGPVRGRSRAGPEPGLS